MSELKQLYRRKTELTKKLKEIKKKIPDDATNKILDAIKNQRWYYLKNKKAVLFDRNTGLIWNNPVYIPFCKEDGKRYGKDEAIKMAQRLQVDGYKNWGFPSEVELKKILYRGTEYPYCDDEILIDNKRIITDELYYKDENGDIKEASTRRIIEYNRIYNLYSDGYVGFLVHSRDLVDNYSKTYEIDVDEDNPIYTEFERLLITLDLFIKGGLEPIFEDGEITKLYNDIYVTKSALQKEIEDIKDKILELQKDDVDRYVLSFSDFGFDTLISKYDINTIDNSLIEYYKAIQSWCDEIMVKLDGYQRGKEDIIGEFNSILLGTLKNKLDDINLNYKENKLLTDRLTFFMRNFSLDIGREKRKILNIKKQVQDLEYRINEIDESENSLYELALIEKEIRPSFSFVVENTIKIVKNILTKVGYFELNQRFVKEAINILNSWSENYRIFKSIYKEDLEKTCEEDGITKELWLGWYNNWQNIRYEIEQKVQPVIEMGLKGDIPTINDNEISVPVRLIQQLEIYKKNIDGFFKENRKDIHQKYAFETKGELLEKIETDINLYKCSSEFQIAIQDIIFDCINTQDRVFILEWSKSLVDMPIDDIIQEVSSNDLNQIHSTMLQDFIKLKQKNYEAYLLDIKAYTKEREIRDKEYNSLIYKMEKGLEKINLN